jgi:methanogenic corrinoid protein MtbC1
MSKIEAIAQAVETGTSKLVGGLVEEALAAGLEPIKILNERN